MQNKNIKIKFGREHIQQMAKEDINRELTEMEMNRIENYCTFCGGAREEVDCLLVRVIDEIVDNTDQRWLKVDKKYLNGRGKNIDNPEVIHI